MKGPFSTAVGDGGLALFDGENRLLARSVGVHAGHERLNRVRDALNHNAQMAKLLERALPYVERCGEFAEVPELSHSIRNALQAQIALDELGD